MRIDEGSLAGRGERKNAADSGGNLIGTRSREGD